LEVVAAGQPSAHRKKKIAKKPIGTVKWAQEDAVTLYSLLNNNYAQLLSALEYMERGRD